RAHPYNAVGFMQPSARSIDGRKLFVLIARNGSTVAFLDIPPGLDAEPLVARRVGVRGIPHFDEDLGARLISVRAVESIEATRETYMGDRAGMSRSRSAATCTARR